MSTQTCSLFHIENMQREENEDVKDFNSHTLKGKDSLKLSFVIMSIVVQTIVKDTSEKIMQNST